VFLDKCFGNLSEERYGEESKKKQTDRKRPLNKAALNQEGTRKFKEARGKAF
jgi:hypothetical protein